MPSRCSSSYSSGQRARPLASPWVRLASQKPPLRPVACSAIRSASSSSTRVPGVALHGAERGPQPGEAAAHHDQVDLDVAGDAPAAGPAGRACPATAGRWPPAAPRGPAVAVRHRRPRSAPRRGSRSPARTSSAVMVSGGTRWIRLKFANGSRPRARHAARIAAISGLLPPYGASGSRVVAVGDQLQRPERAGAAHLADPLVPGGELAAARARRRPRRGPPRARRPGRPPSPRSWRRRPRRRAGGRSRSARRGRPGRRRWRRSASLIATPPSGT